MQTASEDLLYRSGVYRAFALAFSRPDDAVMANLQSAPPPFSPPASQNLTAEYDAIFGHTARGRVSPFGTEWGGEGDIFFQPRELCDIGAFLTAFGLVNPADSRERQDHIRVQLEFMSFLARKNAYALDTHDDVMRGETSKAQRLFLRDHLARFAPAFGMSVARENGNGWYGSLGNALKDFMDEECARLDVAPGPASLRVCDPMEVDVPMACGGCDAASTSEDVDRED